jgi:hypothetical protein
MKQRSRALRSVVLGALILSFPALYGCNLILGLNEFKDACPGVEEGKDCPDAGLCIPGEKVACYNGPTATRNVGRCHDGKRTCGTDGLFGECEGDKTPEKEVCGNGQDDDCNGKVDDCPCTPGKKYSCYTAKDQSTDGIGDCKSGKAVCGPDGKLDGSLYRRGRASLGGLREKRG